MSMRNKIAVALTFLSLFVLYPGVTLPMLSLKLFGQVDASIAKMGMNILERENSILQTVIDLYNDNNHLVAFLILFFSIIVPLIKVVLIFLGLRSQDFKLKQKIFSFVKAIGKWSMADVFVVGIFITYLSSRSQPSTSMHEANVLGMQLKLNVSLLLSSKLGVGFYYFLTYCLTSLTALQLFDFDQEAS